MERYLFIVRSESGAELLARESYLTKHDNIVTAAHAVMDAAAALYGDLYTSRCEVWFYESAYSMSLYVTVF